MGKLIIRDLGWIHKYRAMHRPGHKDDMKLSSSMYQQRLLQDQDASIEQGRALRARPDLMHNFRESLIRAYPKHSVDISTYVILMKDMRV